MYRNDLKQTEFLDFYMPFGGKLSAGNRWVKLAAMIPWGEIEEAYKKSLDGTGMGAPAKSGRIAFGALVIKERLSITDEETVEQILENPYLQYFLGLHEFREKALFDPSMMVHFRSRFGQEDYDAINTKIIDLATGVTLEESTQATSEDPEKRVIQTESDDDEDPPAAPPNEGKLLMDATCTPADITYPTDLKLLNEAREKTEAYLDKLHEPFIGERKKPRTYRREARRQFLAIVKQKKPGTKKIRKAIGQQLRFIKRNLAHIGHYLEQDRRALLRLTSYNIKCLQVIHTLYEQQFFMYENRTHSVADRVVSISQPHVRPIVRGKAGKKVEFGAKISISHVRGGYVSLHRLSWDAYNESGDLVSQVEAYREHFGCYPASVHADMIYRTRANRAYCKEFDIHLSGPALGRPRKITAENAAELKAQKKLARQDELDRIPVEGKFGNAKRKGTLGLIMAKLAHTSESGIHIGLIMLNLDTWLREVLLALHQEFQNFGSWLGRVLRAPSGSMVSSQSSMKIPSHQS
jgi:hypothetical protein